MQPQSPFQAGKQAAGRYHSDVTYNEGLRRFMLGVYNYMAMGVALSGLVAFAVANSPGLFNLFYGVSSSGAYGPTMLGYLAIFSPLAFILVLSFGINKLSASAARIIFFTFAGVMGISMSSLFIMYTGVSIVRVFFITAATFSAMSLYGYTTKRDLSGLGSFLIMGLFGIIIASIVNIFMQSSMLHFAISIIGVLVFTGLTAYDTQRIKMTYSNSLSSEAVQKASVYGALSLYLDFINLFYMLLALLGDRR